MFSSWIFATGFRQTTINHLYYHMWIYNCFTLLEHTSSPSVSFCGVRVAHPFTFCVCLLCVFTFWVPCCDVRYASTIKRCSVRLYLQLFVGELMSYLHYLCLFVYSGVQHILFCVFVLFVIRLVYWVHYLGSFSGLYIFDCPFGIL